ncbi:MAG: PaaI family thioesterase [Acidovorax sp.]|uniref:PaaI family thioesterase n=1 Tax=Acidovorax sp. TaxID=1872122 RepID=UPI00391CE925
MTTALRHQLQSVGWQERTLPGFIQTAGPLWTRRESDGWAYGMLFDQQHLNPAARVHGGALMTLLDHAISSTAWEACDRQPCVTVQMDTQFLGAVEAGQFAQARASISHRTRGTVFLRGSIDVDGTPVLMAQAILKVLSNHR